MIKYPKNIKDYLPEGLHKEFAIWAFGCEKPWLNGGFQKCWEKTHPEIPIRGDETISLCFCKMNYLYQQQKSVTQPSVP